MFICLFDSMIFGCCHPCYFKIIQLYPRFTLGTQGNTMKAFEKSAKLAVEAIVNIRTVAGEDYLINKYLG